LQYAYNLYQYDIHVPKLHDPLITKQNRKLNKYMSLGSAMLYYILQKGRFNRSYMHFEYLSTHNICDLHWKVPVSLSPQKFI